MKLSELKNNDKAVIVKVRGRGAFRKRIIEMGFVKGKQITVIKSAPLKDPVEYSIMGYMISLRKSEAELIEVVSEKEAESIVQQEFKGTTEENILTKTAKVKSKIINIALVGNPNCGKTTLFNRITGSKEHVGNYGGVTVDAKKSKVKHNGYTFNITDLPGTYSLTAYSPEELYVRKHIIENVPDIVINVIDASNLERNLYLTTRLIDMDIKVVIALNIYDELIKRGDNFDYEALGKMIGIPIIPTIASGGKGINEILNKISEVYEDRNPIIRHIHINYGNEFEQAIKNIQKEIRNSENSEIINKVAPRFLALNLLEKDLDTQKIISDLNNSDEIYKVCDYYIDEIELQLKDDTETLITDARYGFINGALKETYEAGKQKKHETTKIIDAFLTHKLFGLPLFVFFMWLMFQGTFKLGEYPMQWIEKAVSLAAQVVHNYMADGMLKDLITNGIINGVGGVIVFLPNILLLFFFISLMEDTGYMARAAFIVDKVMHKIGLHGKSFIPLIMGFGCNVPAIMSTRTLENRNDRLITMLINPFMSCSARLPVYLVIIGAIFPENAGTVLFMIYGTGILVSIIVAKIFKKLIFKSEEAPFVMELPPYRIPFMQNTLKHMWHKGAQYLKKMSGIILLGSIIIWALGYFPISDNKVENSAYSNSYIGKIGHFIEPVIKPLGFDWKIGVSIVSGVAAKEIVVSTMGVLYGTEFEPENTSDVLKQKIRNEVYQSGERKGQKVFTPLVSVSFMIFILIYFPCIAVISAVKKESGSWKWAAFMVFYTTGLAWFLSFSIYQIGSLFFV